jgi:hypothetical protein
MLIHGPQLHLRLREGCRYRLDERPVSEVADFSTSNGRDLDSVHTRSCGPRTNGHIKTQLD